MQVYTPFPTANLCALTLDPKRLNNQINECLVILRTLTGWYERRGKKGWPNHPNVTMWQGYEYALVHYAFILLRARAIAKSLDASDPDQSGFYEFYEMGRRDRLLACLVEISSFEQEIEFNELYRVRNKQFDKPPFLNGNPHPRHTEQRLRLYKKDPEYYGMKFFWMRGYIPHDEYEDLGVMQIISDRGLMTEDAWRKLYLNDPSTSAERR